MQHPRVMHPSPSSTPPGWVFFTGVLVLCAAAIAFQVEVGAISRFNGWWNDELFSLWATDPAESFSTLLQQRILTDSNPPIYYLLLFATRLFVADPRSAMLVLNDAVIGATVVILLLIGPDWRMRGFMLAGFAAFLLGGPALRYAVEGRSYATAMMLAGIASWLSVLALDRATRRPAWWGFALLGVAGPLTHVYAGLFCGCLAAGLVLCALLWRRRDLFVIGLAFGAATSLTMVLWFVLLGAHAVGQMAWSQFTRASLIAAGWELKQLIFGSRLALAGFAAIFAAALAIRETRPLATLTGATLALFFALPCALSLEHPIIAGRYWLIGAPLVVVFLTAVAAAALSPAVLSPAVLSPAGLSFDAARGHGHGRALVITGVGAVLLLLATDARGFVGARDFTADKPIWRGAALVAPLLSRCGPASVHVNQVAPFFALAAHAPASVFVDVVPLPNDQQHASEGVGCPVLGWAEHVRQGDDFLETASDGQLLDLLRIGESPDQVRIYRHKSGYVVLRRQG